MVVVATRTALAAGGLALLLPVLLVQHGAALALRPRLARHASLAHGRPVRRVLRAAPGDPDELVEDEPGVPTTSKRRRRKKVDPEAGGAKEQVRSLFEGEDEVEALAASAVATTPLAPAPAPTPKRALEASLLEDIEAFRLAEDADPSRDFEEDDRLIMKVIDTLGTVLSFNFLIIISFFLWFLAGVGGKFIVKTEVIINAFTGAWDVIILPLLTTHMALTFLSFGLEKIVGGGRPEEA